MGNYPYILAGLPEMILDFETGNFDYCSISEEVRELCSESDVRLIDWLEAGFKEENCSHNFYRAVSKSGNRFLREYFDLDFRVRNAKVSFLEGRYPEFPDDVQAQLLKIFKMENLIEREKSLDSFLWEKIGDMVTYGEFRMDNILAILAKAKIADRWSKLDSSTGEIFFRKFITEVRGSFKGTDFDPKEK